MFYVFVFIIIVDAVIQTIVQLTSLRFNLIHRRRVRLLDEIYDVGSNEQLLDDFMFSNIHQPVKRLSFS